MTSETGSVSKSGQESVVLASFDGYRHAEHMLASLGHGFRAKARKGAAAAVVVRGNPDGSLKVTESRVLSASDFTATLMRLSLSWLVGFMGLLATLQGAREGVRAAGARKGHTGSDEHRAHEILAAAGPHAALVLVRCKDPRRGRRSPPPRPTARQIAGPARSPNSSPPLTPVPLTTGYARRSATAPALTGD